MHLSGEPDSGNIWLSGLIHRLADGKNGPAPPVFRILLGIANRGSQNRILGRAEAADRSILREDDNFYAGGT